MNARAEAVSCETCHGPAANYIRSHTRPDLTRAQKGIDGLRDLSLFYNRANACVACHQVLDPALVSAGHPELIFELDGQSSAMPRHWTEQEQDFRLKGWITGQAAALREATAQLMTQQPRHLNSSNHWQALLWIVSRALPGHKIASLEDNNLSDPRSLTNIHQSADSLALQSSVQVPASALAILNRLSATAPDFKSPSSQEASAYRAERLVLALDRLTHAAGTQTVAAVNKPLSELFSLVQSHPDFNPAEFAAALESLRKQLPAP